MVDAHLRELRKRAWWEDDKVVDVELPREREVANVGGPLVL